MNQEDKSIQKWKILPTRVVIDRGIKNDDNKTAKVSTSHRNMPMSTINTRLKMNIPKLFLFSLCKV